MKKRKMLAVVLGTAMVFSLAACGSGKESAPAKQIHLQQRQPRRRKLRRRKQTRRKPLRR